MKTEARLAEMTPDELNKVAEKMATGRHSVRTAVELVVADRQSLQDADEGEDDDANNGEDDE